jgi:hypothetical protein
MLVRHHCGGEIITSVPVESSHHNREDSKEQPCCNYTLAHGMRPAVITTCMLFLCWASEALNTYFTA